MSDLDRDDMQYSRLVSVWGDSQSMFPNGGLYGIDGPAMRWRVRIHNANPVPVFGVYLLACDPTKPEQPKVIQNEWSSVAPSCTEETVVEVPIRRNDDGVYEGEPEFEIRFTDIEGSNWSRQERGLPSRTEHPYREATSDD